MSSLQQHRVEALVKATESRDTLQAYLDNITDTVGQVELVVRFKDPERVDDIVTSIRRNTPLPPFYVWSPEEKTRCLGMPIIVGDQHNDFASSEE